MKKTCLILSLAVFFFSSCQQTPEPTPVDIEAEETAIIQVLDQMHEAVSAEDLSILDSLLHDEILLCGSDPSEFWDKQEMMDLWSQMFEATDPEINLFGDRKLLVSPDGISASAVEQYMMPMWTTSLPFRSSYHLIKEDGQWKVLFMNTAIVPKNEDLPVIDSVLNAE